MRRLARFLLASILPLFAAASLALLAWGIVGWWKFYRDLFVEEETALFALSQETGTLRYRRAGALRSKLLDAKGLDDVEPTPVPWSVPFVGRVEFIDASAGLEPRPLGNRLAEGSYPLGYAVGAYLDPTVNPQAVLAGAGNPAAAAATNQNPAVAASLSASAALAPTPFPPGTFPSTTKPMTTPVARDRALRLPGLREFRDLPPLAVDAQPIDLATLSLTLPPPTFPTAYLHPDHLNEPFPSGEPLDDAERESLAAEIAEAWYDQATQEDARERPRLIYVHRRTIDTQSKRMDRSTSIRLRDGKKRFDFSALPHELDPSIRRPANVRVSTEAGDWEFLVTKTLTFPIACRLAPDRETFDDASGRESNDDAPDLPHSLGRPFDPYGHMEPLPDDPLGDEGRYVVAIERLDRQRLRIEARSAEENVPGEEYWRFRAVVRADYDYAIEQFDWYLRHAEPRPDPSTPRELIYREIRWLSRRKGTTIITERLSDPWPIAAAMAPGWDAKVSLADQAPPARVATHSLIATTVDPIYPKEIFDPAMYGAKNWATPRELPAYRVDQVFMGAGALGLALAGTVAVVRGIFVRRRGPGVDRRGSFLAFRFGMITALAAALLAISAAGWLKVRVDQARDQQALLAELSRLDERFRFERGEPEFPWIFVSTEEFPIGTQLTRVDLGPLPPPEVLDRLLASSPDLRLEIRERGRGDAAGRYALTEQALGSALPEFASFDWGRERLDQAIERGVPLTPEENEQALADMLAGWRRAKENRPTRYLLRQESQLAAIQEGIVIRDGARSWTIDFGERGPRIDADDGRVRRRFLRTNDDWGIVDRRPSSEPSPPFYVKGNLPPPLPPGTRSVLQGIPYDVALEAGADLPEMEPPLVASREEILLPTPPFALPPSVKTTFRVDEMLDIRSSSCTVEFERLPAGDLRAEIVWGDWNASNESKATWTLVVRPDLDWCVERCVVEETYQRELTQAEAAVRYGRGDPQRVRRLLSARAGASTYGSDQFRRRIYSRNAIELRDGRPVLLETQLMAGEGLADGSLPLQQDKIRYAVDLDPPIVPERFDRPTLDSPDPSRRIEPWLPWHRATFFVGIGLLAYAGVRRGIDVWIARRRKRSKPEGSAERPTDEPASQEDESVSSASPTNEAPS